jgi:hypothetical protein
MFLHWGDVLAYFDESVTHLTGFFGGRCVEAGGGHGVDLEEGPHGPQEPLMPQEQGCHLALCVPTDRHRLLRVLKQENAKEDITIFFFFFCILLKVQPGSALDASLSTK